MIKILLSGASGRMGSEIIKLVEQKENMSITCGFDANINNNNEFKIFNDINDIDEDVDVIIDFSVPKATMTILEYARKNNIPIVIATTGFNSDELKIIEKTSIDIPIFRSSNMSLDINLMASIISKVAEVLSDADIEIIETHHNRKIDSPSGTAILLADAINETIEEKKKYNFERMQKREKRDKNEIGFSSIRGGNIVGEHTVKFFGENETLEITHTAYSRQVFAEGAVKAAEFILDKDKGLYSMKDMVK